MADLPSHGDPTHGGNSDAVRPFVYEHGIFDTVVIPGRDLNSAAVTMNNIGQIVFSHGFDEFWLFDRNQGNQFFRIEDPPGYQWVEIAGINDNTQLIGTLQTTTLPKVFYHVVATPRSK